MNFDKDIIILYWHYIVDCDMPGNKLQCDTINYPKNALYCIVFQYFIFKHPCMFGNLQHIEMLLIFLLLLFLCLITWP